jgi:protein TonB
VGGVIQPPQRLVNVAPVYPPIALAARKEGLVILQAIINEDGSVREVKVLRSDPLFDQAAMVAVRQWRFTPPLLNRQPIPVVMTVTVGFTLNK